MKTSRKCQYALKAVFELAARNSDRPVKIQDVAAAQDIPTRFLEVILNQLRHAGFVQSRRGSSGGYMLEREPSDITVGQIVRCVDGPVSGVGESADTRPAGQAFLGDGAFLRLWKDADHAVEGVLDGTTFADLVGYESRNIRPPAPSYTI